MYRARFPIWVIYQNLKVARWPWTHPAHRYVICHAYASSRRCQSALALKCLASPVLKRLWGPKIFFNGSRTLTTGSHAHCGVVCRPMANTWHDLFVYKSWRLKEDPKRKNRGWFGVVRETRGHQQCYHSIELIRLLTFIETILCLKTVPPFTCYNLGIRDPIAIIFAYFLADVLLTK